MSYIIKEKGNGLNAICLICINYGLSESYEHSMCDIDGATQFDYKEDAQRFLKKFKLAREYKVVEVK